MIEINHTVRLRQVLAAGGTTGPSRGEAGAVTDASSTPPNQTQQPDATSFPVAGCRTAAPAGPERAFSGAVTGGPRTRPRSGSTCGTNAGSGHIWASPCRLWSFEQAGSPTGVPVAQRRGRGWSRSHRDVDSVIALRLTVIAVTSASSAAPSFARRKPPRGSPAPTKCRESEGERGTTT